MFFGTIIRSIRLFFIAVILLASSECESDLEKLKNSNEFVWCHLKGVDLKHANLSGANLWMTYTEQSQLEGVNFIGANLNRVKLNKTNKKLANLSKADARRAVFNDANLTEAILFKTNFSEAFLKRTKLHNAKLDKALLLSVIENQLTSVVPA